MRFKYSAALSAAIVIIVLCAAGCSEIEPKTGTRVKLAFPSGKTVTRESIADLSNYLSLRSAGVLGVDKARVDSLSDESLILLLPGKKLPREAVNRLFETTSLEFYYLKRVATGVSPHAPWKMRLPTDKGMPYIFTGPNAQRIDSFAEPKELLRDVVGCPEEKPILSGSGVRPSAYARETRGGWAVIVRFTDDGAKKFYRFTKNHPGEYLAVFYNGSLTSAALIKDPIKGGEAALTGFKSTEEVQAAVSQLNAGVCPVKVKIVSVDHY